MWSNFTIDAAVNPNPDTVTVVPAAPLDGVNPVSDIVGVNCVELVADPCLSVIEIDDGPGSPLGTEARMLVADRTVTEAVNDPNVTVSPVANPDPVNITALPVIPEPGVNDVSVGAP